MYIFNSIPIFTTTLHYSKWLPQQTEAISLKNCVDPSGMATSLSAQARALDCQQNLSSKVVAT
jgi:hypothetical protein